ncbi:hypothetical protein [Marivita sp.]|uniref:hypothetical protein n=1 Tax=Marivita sp. TaxID=2003365 RepID=UPI0025BAEAA7|nr:hypothetical protein [Marivita sp.]
MHHARILLSDTDLRGPEKRVVAILRAWQHGPDAQADIWDDLCRSMGDPRARACLQAFEQMQSLLDRHGWQALTILSPETKGISSDEASVARFVMSATEQDRDTALAEAGFLVSPAALLPLLCAASRFGLPLLCEDCRERVRAAVRQAPSQ